MANYRFNRILVLGVCCVLLIPILSAEQLDSITLHVRQRESFGPQNSASQVWRIREAALEIAPAQAAVVVVDMAERHWCTTVEQRLSEMFPKVKATITAARTLGMRVVLMPTSSIVRYREWPQRQAMQSIPLIELPVLEQDQLLIPPWGKSGGCECGPERPCPSDAAQPLVRMDELSALADFIVDGNQAGELVSLCRQQGITHLFYMGLGSNMNMSWSTSASMVSMKHDGLNVTLVRDCSEALTGNGFDPDKNQNDANVTPERGNQVVCEFIEKKIAPTVDSYQLLVAAGKAPSREELPPPPIQPLYTENEVAVYKPKGASNCYRHLCFDYNWRGGNIEDYFIHSNPVEIAEFCRRINLDALLLLNVPHHGYCTYASEIGPVFPSLQGDWFNEVVRECHKRDIAVFAYISLARNWVYALENPERSWPRDAERYVDLNTPYLDLVVAYSQEVLRRCPVDAIRYDTLEQDPNTQNEWSKEFYRNLYGEELPPNWNDADWRRRLDFLRWSTSRACEVLYQACKEIKPEIEVWQNGFMQQKEFDINNLEAGRYQDIAYIESGDPFRQLFLTGVLRLKGTIVGGILKSPVRRLCLALGARCYSYFAVNRETILPDDPSWFYNDLAPFYQMVEEITPYLVDARPIPYVGILYAEATRYRWQGYNRSRYVDGLMRPLTEAYLKRSLPVEFLCNLDLPKLDLSHLKLIVIPETSGLKLDELDALRRYVRQGGQILVTGEALLYDERGERLPDFSLAEECGVSYEKRMSPSNSFSTAIPASIQVVENDALESAFRISSATVDLRQVVTGRATQGKTVLTLPGNEGNIPLLQINQVGEGRAAYLATSDDLPLLQAVIAAMVPSVPVTVRSNEGQVILTRQEKENRWILHLLSDGPLTVDIHRDYAAPKRVVAHYPEGWDYTIQPMETGLRITVDSTGKNRLLLLE